MRQAAFDWGIEDSPLVAVSSGGSGGGEKPRARDYGLRWYQAEAKAAVERELLTNQSTLLNMATGCGKTQVFSAIAGDWPGNVLILANRDELIEQGRKTVERLTGEEVFVEQGPLRAPAHARIVMGSLQSFNAKRLARIPADRFSLVILDEGHCALAPTYKRALEHFQGKRLLVTATPDRGDGKALGAVSETVAYQFDIERGIEQGYLVPFVGKTVELKEIDLSNVGTSAGDLIASQLDEAMLRAVAGIVKETMRLQPSDQTIGFMPGIQSAKAANDLCNELKPGSSIFICGDTDTDERRELASGFREGRYQYLWNVGIAVEGFDAPLVSCVVLGRPTKSRGRYTQMVGRGGRVLPKTVDHLAGEDMASARRAAISDSGKPHCTILDFVGNSGKHSLVSPVDVLGGSFSDEEKVLAKKKLKEKSGDVREALAQARKEIRAITEAAKKTKVTSQVRDFNPFSIMHIALDHQAPRTPMTSFQFDDLVRIGLTEDQIKGMSRSEAQKFIGANRVRRKHGLATYKQLRALQKFGVTDINLSVRKAAEVLDYLIGERKAYRRPNMAVVEGMLHRKREMGED